MACLPSAEQETGSLRLSDIELGDLCKSDRAKGKVSSERAFVLLSGASPVLVAADVRKLGGRIFPIDRRSQMPAECSFGQDELCLCAGLSHGDCRKAAD